jgi:glycosyltransferase involved in cell wall biosynthesis
MRILQVNSSAQLGGAETVARQLRDGCQAAGHESALAVGFGRPIPGPQGVRALYPRLLSRFYYSRFHRLTDTLFPHRQWTNRAFGRLRNSPWDVIHIHNFHGDYARIETLAALAAAKPVVWTFHGCWGFTGGCDHTGGCDRYQQACGSCPSVGKWPFLRTDDTADQLSRKLQFLRAAPIRVVSPSRWLARKIESSQVGSRWDVRVVPNGAHLGLFRGERKRDREFRAEMGLDPGATVVLLVLRDFDHESKGFGIVRESLAWLSRRRDAQVVYVGRNAGKAAAATSGLRSVTPGYIDDRRTLARYYEAADILLFASPEENFPCVVVEAMAAECCVVATPTGGVLEQIETGRTGLLAGAIDGVALAEALKGAFESGEAELRRLGRAARERALMDFSEEAMVSRYLAIYAEAA